MRPFLALASTAAAAALALAAAPRSAHATQCTPARAMVVLDKSSSMTQTLGGISKWQIAKNALTQVATGFEHKIDLGLMVFPNPNQCSPGTVNVDCGPGNKDEILGALGAAPPTGGNYTPMSQTLDAAAQVPSLNDPARSRYVVLVTDGWQWCDPYDPSTRFDPVESVAQLKARGITTFVVGFGGSVDALTLNQMAVTAGTALPGCDPAGDEPGLPDPCYFQADDPGELEAALMQIGVVISGETCDGQDNDCDGLVDEDLTRECASACGTGTETCESGQWVGCSAPPPGQEICDGQDNDCDGVADPGCECTVGDTRACGDGTGACAPGTQTCRADGTWSDCEGAVGPMPEMCNGLDDDCDGVVDGDADDEVPGAGDDDVGLAGALCPAGQMCKDGSCGDLGDPVVPPVSEADDASGDASGCGCRAGGRASGRAGAGLVIGLAALALVRRRRRA